uniref:T2SSG domain-containing protein n=1 Tax=Syphacia muris TaxID=451379 RepID=A0A0N5AWY5_9BILA
MAKKVSYALKDERSLLGYLPSNAFTNNYGYGPFGVGPSNSGFDSFGFWKTKYTNSGLNPLYTWQSYRNYYGEFAVHNNRYNNPAPADFENLQEERFGPYYNGIWGYVDHSPYWNGK